MELDGHAHTIPRCAQWFWTATASRSSPTRRSRRGRASSCACAPAGSAGRTSRSSGARSAGTVLGHEVEGELADGTRVTVAHRVSCGRCARCVAGHESTCAEFATLRIEPGGFAERLHATHVVPLPADDRPAGRGLGRAARLCSAGRRPRARGAGARRRLRRRRAALDSGAGAARHTRSSPPTRAPSGWPAPRSSGRRSTTTRSRRRC